MRRKPVGESGISYARKAGWLLAHNSIRPTVDQQHGVNGFRRFWVPPDQGNWKLCNCGWRPDLGPHYSGLAQEGQRAVQAGIAAQRAQSDGRSS